MMVWGNEGETFFSKEVAIEALFFSVLEPLSHSRLVLQVLHLSFG